MIKFLRCDNSSWQLQLTSCWNQANFPLSAGSQIQMLENTKRNKAPEETVSTLHSWSDPKQEEATVKLYQPGLKHNVSE